MSEDKRVSTGQGIVMTVFPIAGLVLGHIAYGIENANYEGEVFEHWLFCVIAGGAVGAFTAWCFLICAAG